VISPLVLLRLMRPKQWTKNLFVISPVVFSGRWADPAAVLFELLAAVAFILASGAVYAINDSADQKADQQHPKKRFRPVAAGQISVIGAKNFAVVLALSSLLLAAGISWQTALVTAAYLLLNLAYSIWLKHMPLIDVLVIAGGFLLRVTAGCVAIQVVPSQWLLLCTAFLALFIALVKRRQELARGNADATRKVMAGYSLPLLDQFITSMLSTTILTYLMYAHSVHPPLFMVTVVFVVYGLFRYLYILHFSDRAERPEDAVFADLPLLATVLLWGSSCLAFLYHAKSSQVLAP
jgi:decaprenyl-phosphate phosphoribosyltransferase